MFSLVSTNAPMVGSSVNPCTPWPVVYTSTVDGPYTTYPAATCVCPGCSMEACRSPSVVSGSRRSTLKMVPTFTLTSMLEEPSSGSKTMMYLPVSTERSKVTGSSSSSLTSAATESRRPRQCSSAWLAYTSSFCCCSPCTLVCPIAPRASLSPAVRIFASTILVASVMPLSSQLNSPARLADLLLLLQDVLLHRRNHCIHSPTSHHRRAITISMSYRPQRFIGAVIGKRC